jgi:hypothetical protein
VTTDRARSTAFLLGLAALLLGLTTATWRGPLVFAPDTLEFWASTGLGLCSFVLLVVGLVARSTGRHLLVFACTAAPAGALWAVAFGGPVAFASSPRVAWGVFFLLGSLWNTGLVFGWVRLPWRERLLVLLGPLVAAPVGGLWLVAQRPLDAGVHPQRWPAWEPPALVSSPVRLPCGALDLELLPELTFRATSRDGLWPALGSADPVEHGAGLDVLTALREVDGGLLLESRATLDHAVAAHLVTLVELRLPEALKAAVEFEALDAGALPLLPFDYPQGRPAHFVTWNGRLQAWRATSGDKGPFFVTAEGPLSEEAPLRFTLLREGQPACTVTVFDFQRQAGTGESPTAGEGVPVNVLQYGLPGDGGATGVLRASLAETGMGAGLRMVRYPPGTYRALVLVTQPASGAPPH